MRCETGTLFCRQQTGEGDQLCGEPVGQDWLVDSWQQVVIGQLYELAIKAQGLWKKHAYTSLRLDL